MTKQLVVLEGLIVRVVSIFVREFTMVYTKLTRESIGLIERVIIVRNKLINIFKVILHIALITLHIMAIRLKWCIIIKVKRLSSTTKQVISIRSSRGSIRTRSQAALGRTLPKQIILVVHIKVIEQIIVEHIKVVAHIVSMVHTILRVEHIARLKVRIKAIKHITIRRVIQRIKLLIVVDVLIIFLLLNIRFFLRLFLGERTRYIYLGIPKEHIPLDIRQHNNRSLSFHVGHTLF